MTYFHAGPPDTTAMKRLPRQSHALEPVERHLARGEWQSALRALLPELEARATSGDHACALATRLLRVQDSSPAAPDALAAALDRLVALVERQEAQISALQALVEETL